MKNRVAPGYTFVKKVENICEYRLLANDLQVLLMQEPQYAGVVGLSITYRVGSRHEAVGYTGATHLLEHLMFKESKNFRLKDNNTIKQLLEKRGAEINAMTWQDATCYYAMLPAQLFATALAIERDRMRDAIISKTHLDSEMTVVRNELEWRENNPHRQLYEGMMATAFHAHPYHHPIIGWRSDVENMPIDKLQWFYNEYYHPNNATLLVIGDFNTEKILKEIRTSFSDVPKKLDLMYEPYTKEPEQRGVRRFTINKTGENIVSVAYKIPHALHEDIPALAIASTILDNGKTSRLYKAFIDKGLALSTSAFAGRQYDPSLFTVTVTLTNKITHEEALRKIDSQLQKLIKTPVTASELAIARSSVRMWRAQKTVNAYGVIDYLADCISQGDWTYFYRFSKLLEKVTAKDIQRVAKKYFIKNTQTTGLYVKTH